MLIVAPSGIVNDEISLGTPSVSHDESVNGIVAVSYTHLDVYKRQY